MRRISQGRTEILALPRDLVLCQIEEVANATLNLGDDWEYRRLLEVAELLGDPALIQRLIQFGVGSPNPEIADAASDFKRQLPAPDAK